MTESFRRRLVPRDATVAAPPRTVPAHATPDYVLRNRARRRSAELIDAVSRVDTVTDPMVQRQLADWLNDQYRQRDGGTLFGLFGHCYLGHPYVDHQMDLGGCITRHFTAADSVPPMFVGARAFARSTAYLYIEVYDDGMVVPIRADGSSAI